jgi:3-oxoadipate enol-lactonase
MSHIYTASGRRIFYDEVGSGPPIVLIPGQSGDRRGCMSWLAETLAHSGRVVSMDNRDSGESDPEPDYYRLSDMAGDVADLLDALGIHRAHVLGHSLGGKIALQLALDHPDRIDRLVLISARAGDGKADHRAGEPLPPPYEWWVDEPIARMRRLLHDIVGSHYRARMGEAEISAIAELERDNHGTWAGTMRQEAALDGHGLRDRLSAIRAPTLVVRGDEDAPEHGRELAAGIPDARLLILPGVGHLPWVERPDEATRAIRDFLGGTGRADHA